MVTILAVVADVVTVGTIAWILIGLVSKRAAQPFRWVLRRYWEVLEPQLRPMLAGSPLRLHEKQFPKLTHEDLMPLEADESHQNALREANVQTGFEPFSWLVEAALVHGPDGKSIVAYARTPRGAQEVGYFSDEMAEAYLDDFLKLDELGYDYGLCGGIIVNDKKKPRNLNLLLLLDEPGKVVPADGTRLRRYGGKHRDMVYHLPEHLVESIRTAQEERRARARARSR